MTCALTVTGISFVLKALWAGLRAASRQRGSWQQAVSRSEKSTCPVGHVSSRVHVPGHKIYVPRALGHALISSPGSISWSHPFALTNSPKLSGAFPNCLTRSTRMVFTDSHHIVNLWSVNFPSSSCRFQCLFSRCRELHSAIWHFQQLFSGRKKHTRCIASICLHKSLWGTLQMSRMAVVPDMLPLLSFSTPALSSIVITLLSYLLNGPCGTLLTHFL